MKVEFFGGYLIEFYIHGLILIPSFQYKELQGGDSYVVVGIENQSGNDGVAYDRNLLVNGLALKIKPVTGKEAVPKQEVKYELKETDYQWIDVIFKIILSQECRNKITQKTGQNNPASTLFC